MALRLELRLQVYSDAAGFDLSQQHLIDGNASMQLSRKRNCAAGVECRSEWIRQIYALTRTALASNCAQLTH